MSSELVHRDKCATFVLRPNEAPSWTQIKVFFAIVGGTSLSVAVFFTSMGMWPVLPFAGAEVTLLGWALYYTARNSQFREVVQIDTDVIEIARGRKQAEQVWRLRSAWAKVRLVRSKRRNHPSRLLISADGEQIEIGRFLLEDERENLAREIRAAVQAVAV